MRRRRRYPKDYYLAILVPGLAHYKDEYNSSHPLYKNWVPQQLYLYCWAMGRSPYHKEAQISNLMLF